ncbi:hypothetical protein [Actinoallomurus iriomotensis]|uniref:Uncharacterized protein n=1 Tax=Actinoallomurus iriomotensis TaxID=478107 RepID=A0A9W6RGK7_9ACTN|nr:hypothetical protein [Actinoallomurus iriomotensis]GLY74220.1 hypothetical protein Airi01_024870 [Actinoallomurus iriomotensis]
MLQPPARRPSNAAVMLILGFVVATVVLFVVELGLDYTLKLHSAAAANVVSVVLDLLLGALVGGAMCLARPRNYGLAAVAAVVAAVAGFVADEASLMVYFALHHYPVGADLITDYFTHARAILWIGMVIEMAVAAGLTALRVRSVIAADGRPAGPQWGPPGPPAGPWAPPPYGAPPNNWPPPPGPQAPPPGPYGPYGPPPAGPGA